MLFQIHMSIANSRTPNRISRKAPTLIATSTEVAPSSSRCHCEKRVIRPSIETYVRRRAERGKAERAQREQRVLRRTDLHRIDHPRVGAVADAWIGPAGARSRTGGLY